MDIIDVILGRALSSQGQISTYAAMAQKAVSDATAAISGINSITEQTNTNNEAAEAALQDASDALALVQQALEDIDAVSLETIIAKIKQVELSKNTTTSSTAIINDIITTYPDESQETLANIVKYYRETGNNEDGTMTQKAITAAIQAGGGGSGSGSSIHFDIDQEGHILIVDDDGNITTSNVHIDDLIAALMKTDTYHLSDAFGVDIDYTQKTFTRSANAETPTTTADFNKYKFLSGRKRCNVADNGTITAFYGEAGYKDDGTNGQVMVYQPKFYYQRIINESHLITGRGTAIDKETLILSDKKLNNLFKLHPIFKDENGNELDYILLPAYEGSIYDTSVNDYDRASTLTIDFNNDKLCSIGSTKPISGAGNNGLTLLNAEKLAQNRGAGWHTVTLMAENVNQMLMTTEFNSMNGQNAIEDGVVNLQNLANKNCASLTGSTASLGNSTGAATSTTNEIDGAATEYSDSGKRSITYRGVENPWGNLWTFSAGVCAIGDGNSQGGKLYIAKNYNYAASANDTSNYTELPLILPNNGGWIYKFGYCGADYDWLYIPIECSASANSEVPVGDYFYVTPNLNGIQTCLLGGTAAAKENGGMFYYTFNDCTLEQSRHAVGANLMFIPTKNNIYDANVIKWQSTMGV